jgi:hypothetical protein
MVVQERRYRKTLNAKKSMIRTLIYWTLLTFVGISGCTPAKSLGTLEEPFIANKLPFLQDGRVKREEIVARFGPPAAEYDRGRVVSYSASLNDADELLICPCPTADYYKGINKSYKLIMVYTPDGVLKQHSLLSPD